MRTLYFLLQEFNDRCYYHRAKSFLLKGQIYGLLRLMRTANEDEEFVELLLVGLLGLPKIRINEIDRDALDLIFGAHS